MKHKYKLNALKKAYFKIPNKIHGVGLSATAIAIYSYMAMQAETFDPAISVIARSLKLSKTTVIKYLKELQDRNIIKCYDRGAERKISKYEFVNLDDWK